MSTSRIVASEIVATRVVPHGHAIEQHELEGVTVEKLREIFGLDRRCILGSCGTLRSSRSSSHFAARPLVVVGIENTERRRDMTEPTQVESDKKIAPHVGGAAKFRAFIADELIPRIKRDVRVTKSAIAGESLAGLFVLETLFAEPTLFDTWIAISPSLQWNGGALARAARRWLETHPALAGTLYLARAGDDFVEPIDTFAAALRSSAPRGLTWFYEPCGDLHHANIYETVAPAVMRRLWPRY